ncbi:MAG: hypothetical protein WC719_03875 [Patescibacteria group bacterium]|jgi:hypothetical protein
MKSFLNFKKETEFKTGKKLVLFLLVFSVLAVFTLKDVQAQGMVVADPISNAALVKILSGNTVAAVKLTFWQRATKMIQKAGSLAFQRVLSSALNKIAYDTANYIGSGGKGQKPLFITKSLGAYIEQIGDEAAGQFIESFVNNLNNTSDDTCFKKLDSCRSDCASRASGRQYWTEGTEDNPIVTNVGTGLTNCNAACDKAATSCAAKTQTTADQVTPSFNVCSPSSLEAKIRIGLGLVEQTRPAAPNCTASRMIKDWGDSIQKKLDSLQDPNYLDTFVNIFDPRTNDVGIFVLAQTDLSSKVYDKKLTSGNSFIANKGWADVRDISGALKGVPGEAQAAADSARAARQQALGKTTGDILVDAANVFLNQLYFSAFNNLLQTLGEKTTKANKSSIASGNYESDPNANVSATALKEITTKLLQTNFGVRADYDILSELSICTDSKNPGPTECVIDDQFMQGITEKKTIAEAVKEGYLHGDWQLTKDNRAGAYSLRNISILRKYRILPVGWEEAINRAFANDANQKKANLKDYMSCFDSNDQYAEFSKDFNVNDQGWCEGLIDPNWVLKAPMNSCSKEGFGAQILSKTVMPSSDNTPSELSLSRADSYCADSQTCIKEKSDGSCDAYGYCDEERRTWVFGSDSCQPINNTCQDFTNTDSGTSVAYLENTLDYDSCTSENSGCRQYSYNGVYASSTDSVSWNGGQSVYLNKNAGVCDNTTGGCTELMRLKPTWGGNLVMNADFGSDEIGQTATQPALNTWPLNNARATVVNSAATPGDSSGKALKIETSATGGGVYSNPSASLLPSNFQTISGQSYTLSADLYLTSGDSASISLGAVSEGFSKTITTKNVWQHVNITRLADSAYNNADFFVSGYSVNGQATFYLKNLKFEISSWDTGYNAYGKFTVYEKLLPAYLEKSCYVDAVSAAKDYSLKSDAPAACSNFARKCNQSEAGCELYSSAADNFAVPAKVVSSDYCSDKCLGYDVYIAKASYFNPAAAENLIPAAATVCSAEASGCNEFTNLDALASGGEQKEYYTSLKQCVKPAAATCTTFYSWEGTEGGYQLKSYSLKSLNGLPEVTSNDSALCNAAIYNLPISNAGYNADCREFYNASGQVSYHLASRTITCSDNCHAYRLSDKNIVKNLTAAQCTGSDKHWNAGDNTCNVCANGGVWDTNNNACVYQAIPGEGQTCSANENSCREYNGNSGNNVRLVASYDFESGAAAYWTSNCTNGLSVSTIANTKNGHSLQYLDAASGCQLVGTDAGAPIAKTRLMERILASDNVAAQLAVGNSVNQNSAYTVKFLARATTDASLKIYFLNRDTGGKSYFNASSTLIVKGGDQWNIYQANLADLDHAVGPNERLIISANANFLFDDFVLSEITDRYYLIKGSSQIPDVCYYDIFDKYQGADYNLGCSQYADRGGLMHNLRQFSKLCSDSAVGCEQMVDTKNYSSYKSGIWNDTNNNNVCDPTEVDCVKVAGDSAIYAVYDPNKLCTSASKGCSRLGQGQGGAIVTSWVDVYRQNNPDTYAQSLCQKPNVGCEEWQNSADSSVSYFKNPGSNTCTYRASTDPKIFGKAWYKIAAKRCDANSDNTISGTEKGIAICTSDTDCAAGKCIIDNNDYPCSTSYDKTIGLGGAGNQVWIPDTAAGLCNANESGCTEYIDPVSQFSVNLVFNSSYQTIEGVKEGWGFAGETFAGQRPTATQQIVRLEPNKLYSFTVKYGSGVSGDVSLSFVTVAKPLLSNNNFGATTNSFTISSNLNQPIIFNSINNSSVLVSGGAIGKTIELRELVVDYQLKANTDKTSCNGLVNFDDGCVLFNERSVSGSSGLVSLEKGWDAYKTVSGATPTACSPSIAGSCTANQLLKVRPDRVCSKWLDCVTYIEDPATKTKTCYAVAECNRLDDKNECANFITMPATTRSFDANNDRNATGYSLLNKYHFSQIKQVGFNSDFYADFETSLSLSCHGNIDFSGPKDCPTDLSKAYSIINEPENAPTDYPAQGKSYLKVVAPYQVSTLGDGSDAGIQLTSPALGETNTYYLNYMVNTRGTSLRTKVIITDTDGVVKKDALTGAPLIFYAAAPNGWETKIVKFDIGQGSNKVKIYLTSDTVDLNDANSVYFDNLSIEPVLEIGNNQYAARECRLYPTEDSLTCETKNSNVIKNGLEGYCLEHDSYNPNVCLLWYPVDKISTTRISQPSAYGYKGVYPLDYCTELNGNFDIVDNRTAYWLRHDDSNHGYCDNAYEDDGFKSDSSPCAPGYNRFYYEYSYTRGSVHHCNSDEWCVPKNDTSKRFIIEVVRTADGDSTFPDPSLPTVLGSLDPANFYQGPVYFWSPASTGYTRLLANSDHWVRGSNVSGINYDGFHARLWVLTDGWYKYGGNSTEAENQDLADPSIRVYDYAHPPLTETDLKLISGDDSDALFRLTCNKFIQVVDESGKNKAWAARIEGDPAYPDITPRFFVDNLDKYYGALPKAIDSYGRNRATVPFGAASLPDDLSTQSTPVSLLDRDLKTSGENNILAGRPYGCANGSTSNGCKSIGYCSSDKNVYCLTAAKLISGGDSAVGNLSCGSLGSCVPLWAQPLSPVTDTMSAPDYKNILKTIFMKSFKSYNFKDNAYVLDSNSYSDFTAPAANLPRCTNDKRIGEGLSSFCWIKPVVSNIKLYFGATNTVIPASGIAFDILNKGVYRLEFNSVVDKEQQPLKEIIIDWGDGSLQTITGEDHHPTQASPHVFYHYYSSKGLKTIKLEIRDNWGMYWRNY